VLHFSVCESFGQALPPALAGELTSRLRVRDPEPHFFEHAPHFSQAETRQLTGQALMLHGFDIVSLTLQDLLDPFLRERCLNCRPPPQGLLHDPHLPHAFTWQRFLHERALPFRQ